MRVWAWWMLLVVAACNPVHQQSATEAPAAAAEPVPVSNADRLKFPTADPALVDGLAYVNREINAMIRYRTDKDQYGVDELWVMVPRSWEGDCEDYVLTKMETLRQGGLDTVWTARIVFARVGPDEIGHAILAVRLDDGSVAYLDNGFSALMTRPELEQLGYRFQDW